MFGRVDRFRLWLALAALGVAALILAVLVVQWPSPAPPPSGRVRVISSMAEASAPVRDADPTALPDWTGAERGAVVNSLHLPINSRLRDVTGTQTSRQVLCGRVQPSSDQPFRRFTYVKTAKLGAIDDGGADFAEAYAQLCNH